MGSKDYIDARHEGEWRLPPGLRYALPYYARRKWVHLGEPIPLFEHLHKTFGPIAHYRFMGTLIVFINDPAWIQEVLINQAGSFIKERTLKRMKNPAGRGTHHVGRSDPYAAAADCGARVPPPANRRVRRRNCPQRRCRAG